MGVTRVEAELEAIKNEVSRIADAEIQSVQSDWNQNDNTQADFIKNKPTIPDAQVNADWDEADETSKAFIQNKPIVAIGSADGKKIFLNSSTDESTKVFEITVIDDGTLTATEVTTVTE